MLIQSIFFNFCLLVKVFGIIFAGVNITNLFYFNNV